MIVDLMNNEQGHRVFHPQAYYLMYLVRGTSSAAPVAAALAATAVQWHRRSSRWKHLGPRKDQKVG